VHKDKSDRASKVRQAHVDISCIINIHKSQKSSIVLMRQMCSAWQCQQTTLLLILVLFLLDHFNFFDLYLFLLVTL